MLLADLSLSVYHIADVEQKILSFNCSNLDSLPKEKWKEKTCDFLSCTSLLCLQKSANLVLAKEQWSSCSPEVCCQEGVALCCLFRRVRPSLSSWCEYIIIFLKQAKPEQKLNSSDLSSHTVSTCIKKYFRNVHLQNVYTDTDIDR